MTEAVLSPRQVLDIYHQRGKTFQYELARKYGVTLVTIGAIQSGKRYHLLTGAKRTRNPVRGERQHASKLTEEQVLSIAAADSDLSSQELGEKFGVNASTIRMIRKGKTWGWLTGIGSAS